jgi:rRNA maturation protein Nop10
VTATLVVAPQSGWAYTMYACSECGSVVFNAMTPNDFWQCDHGPYGTKRRRTSERELLEEILVRVKRLEEHAGVRIRLPGHSERSRCEPV